MINSDQLPKSDTLGRLKFANEIATNILEYLKKSDESLVIGIHGEWGSGKSAFLDYVKKDAIAQNKDLTIVEFNPWMFVGKEELHSIFLNQLSRIVGIQEFQEQIKSLTEKSYKSLTKLKGEISDLLVKENIKLLIIIDDLDRLAPSETLELFQLIKLNANFKNTVFLVSFDKAIVVDAIEERFSTDGHRYLEKIIQVDYSLPAILPEDIESIFFTQLRALLDEYDIKFDHNELASPWITDGLKYYFKNIRDIHRYINSLHFRLPAFHKNIDIHDFLLLEAIRLFDFESYELIRDSHQEALRYNNSKFAANLQIVKSGFSGDIYSRLVSQEFRGKKKDGQYRISDPEFFSRYFSLSVSKKDMREEEFSNFITHEGGRSKLLESVISNGKVDFLLRRLLSHTFTSDENNISNFIDPLIVSWDKYPEAFVSNWRTVWSVIKLITFSRSDRPTAMRFLIDKLNSVSGGFSPARFVYIWVLLQNIDPIDVRDSDPDLMEFIEILKTRQASLEQSFKTILTNFSSQFFFTDTYHNLYQRIFITSFAKFHFDIYKANFRNIIVDDQKVFKILNLFVFRDSSTGEPFGIDVRYIPIILQGDLKNELLEQLSKFNLYTHSNADSKAIKGALNYLQTSIDPFTSTRNKLQ